MSIAYVLILVILGEPCLKHVLREILQDTNRINHAGVDLLRVHLDGQEAYTGVQRLKLIADVGERAVCSGWRAA